MAGKHRRGAVQVPVQRGGARPPGMVDARTRLEHLVTDESAFEHRHSGRYLALCGAQVLAASLVDPGRGRCQVCEQVSS